MAAFDPAKDVIDLSGIDANLTAPGLQNFTFIGSAPFSGTGAQVRYQLNPTKNVTYVQVDLAGDEGIPRPISPSRSGGWFRSPPPTSRSRPLSRRPT